MAHVCNDHWVVFAQAPFGVADGSVSALGVAGRMDGDVRRYPISLFRDYVSIPESWLGKAEGVRIRVPQRFFGRE